MAQPIRVVVHGAAGKMGREVLNALCHAPDLKPVGAVDKAVSGDELALPDGSGAVPFSSDLASIIARTKPDVLIDFSTASAAMPALRTAVQNGVRPVVGTTGLSPADVQEIETLCQSKHLGGVVAANFSLGAVMLMHLSQIAGKYFDFAEIIELHHDQKADAPSGTALATARMMAEARGKPFIHPQTSKQNLPGTRGGELEGISIHSVRLQGLLAHQEVILGGLGQTLTIRHDSISRESFMPGVVLAAREVMKLDKLVIGLDRLLGL
ncbi:MAG: 4-hydroxy-tetrahydrodipicolinate reductase [Dehalococcoidia bacterium]|nr:4-hydroxy-tetrahydrodipicolinate reductase [Dehalococcoidia bacterium]